MSNSLKINKPLVSVNWLHQHIEATNLIVLNGTLPKVTVKSNEEKREEYQIPTARFFDIKKVFSVQGAEFPNTMLSVVDFEAKARELGVYKDSCIVVYDEYGIYSAPRVWWLFKTMGFDNIAVLNGGLPAWKNANHLVEEKQEHHFEKGDFTVNYNSELLIDSTTVLNLLNNPLKQILDARSAGRFHSTEPEPRAEIRSGHIPNSKNLPYSALVSDGKLKEKEELQHLFKEVNSNNSELIFSCGSGITACVLALGATVSGYHKLSVYDGSWTEWGSLSHLPIEK